MTTKGDYQPAAYLKCLKEVGDGLGPAETKALA